MPIGPVARQTVADQVFDQLLRAILTGEDAPGTQLPPERELAVQAGVNRQAVREALQRLRQMGLVEIVHGGGITVRDWRTSAGLALLPMLVVVHDTAVDPVVSRSIMELRAVIGADAARLCARRAPGGTAAVLGAIVDEMDALDGDWSRWGLLGYSYWDAVVGGADNVAYLLAYNTLREVAVALALAERMPPGLLTTEWRQTDLYRELAAAIGAGDAETAGRIAGRLLGAGVAAVDEWLHTLPGERNGSSPA
ncbi:FadR family transcriptional regulator [Iamia sp. SCSIO 61187]|uniref:FadR/GntR family transcriptional regulator n=1 Tax=Iamia sp. SCSIO 61187 TaxID=2722752 RepID=UPI001C62594C|nr:GntR family transcriptional regulator [Iamia sp. SCSIO 61187]QYG95079.1 FadR family transcriptional regulator [Iamia sp. SCSIO 61187]